MTLSLDDNKRVSVVTTEKVLELLGFIGGFKEAINIIFSIFGLYISSRLFKANLIKTLLKEDIMKNNNNNQNFSLSSLHIIFEPLVSCIV